MKSGWLTIWLVITALLAAGPVSAGQAAPAASERASDYYEQAQILLRRGDLAAAVIQLKNALQQNPQLLPARVLLGQAYVRQGDGAAGEHELLRADRLGADPSMTAVPLAKAYLQQAKYKELLDRLQPASLPVDVRAELLVSRGHAYLALGKLDQARHAFQAAAQLRPDDAAAVVGQSLVRLRRGDIKGAGELADKAVRMSPKDADAWNLKASVSHLRGDLQQALAGYDKVLALQPQHLDARLARAAVLIDLRRDQQAQEDLAYINEHFPHEPRASYLRGLLLARQGDTKGSRAAMLECVATVSHLPADLLNRRPQLLLLGGLANYSLDQWEKARDYLQRYLTHNAGDVGARKLLGAILLKSKEYDHAADVLEPALQTAPNDYRLLALLGTVYMNQRRYLESTAMLARAAKLSGDKANIRVDVAINHLAAGNSQLGMDQLADIFRQHPEQMSAGVLLVVHYLRKGKPDRAAEVAAKLSLHYPHNLAILNLLGTAQARAGQRDAAARTFHEALQLAPAFIPAKVALARLELAGGQPEAARQRLSAILKTHPENLETLSALAEVEKAEHHSGRAIRWLEKATAAHPKDVQTKLALVDLYLAAAKPDKALELANEAALAAPRNLEALAASARCYLVAGKPAKAAVTASRMSLLAGFDPRWQYRIARLQYEAGATDDAQYSLTKALQGDPGFVPAQVTLTELLLRGGHTQQAAERARKLERKYPDRSVGYRLTGDVLMHARHYAAAVRSYQEGMARQPDSQLVVRLYRARSAAGHEPAARKGLEQWLGAHPNDPVVARALAAADLRSGNFKAAAKRYRQLLGNQRGNATLLNNLAYAYLKTNDPRALETARAAYRAAPDNAAVNDTLGWALVRDGKPDLGLSYLRNAQYRAAQDPEIRYHVAVALLKLGRRDEARSQLDTALQSGGPFDGRDRALQLQRQLRRTGAADRPPQQ